MAFPAEIATRLVAQGVGTLGTTIFIGSKANIPPGDGPFLSLIETGGTGPARTQNNTATQRPSMQIVVRGKSAVATRTMSRLAWHELGNVNGLWGIKLTDVMYVSITARQEPTDIGLDALGRIMFSFNIDAEKQPS